MNVQLVDEIARALATRVPRRQALRGLGGSAGAVVLTRWGLEEAGAKPEKCKKRKKIGQKCKLKNGTKCKCRGGAHCKGGLCRCPNGTQEVNGVCQEVSLCLGNGSVCPNSDSDSCCSGFCTYEGPIDEVEPTCCVPNDESCDQTSDCCGNDQNPSLCEGGRCCRAEGGTCATPNGVQIAECCSGLVCDLDNTQQCI
ncbi:MAG: hypothetical protein M3509_10060 [Chloroflexota bacterium]|nr:hypothetical protein [Chloroflexota bacterium]